MDELRDKLACMLCLVDEPCDNHPTANATFENCLTCVAWLSKADEVIDLFKSSGYIKVQGEPPLLSEDAIIKSIDLDDMAEYESGGRGMYTINVRPLLLAQRASDIKFYEGK